MQVRMVGEPYHPEVEVMLSSLSGIQVLRVQEWDRGDQRLVYPGELVKEIIQMDQQNRMELELASRKERMFKVVMVSGLDKAMEVGYAMKPKDSQLLGNLWTASHPKTKSSKQISRRQSMDNLSQEGIKVAQDSPPYTKVKCVDQIR